MKRVNPGKHIKIIGGKKVEVYTEYHRFKFDDLFADPIEQFNFDDIFAENRIINPLKLVHFFEIFCNYIPESNDPSLNERMQNFNNVIFDCFQAKFPDTEKVILEIECINEQKRLFTGFYSTLRNIKNRLKINHYLQFLDNKVIPSIPQSQPVTKSFPQFLINIPGNENDLFASMLKEEFKLDYGIKIRYLIDALSELKLMVYGDREKSSLYNSLAYYFNRPIGSRQSIFPAKSVTIFRDNINNAIDRINQILLKIKSKN